ncbi:hypothetical protein L208DRAFT_269468 [Tricholoma matsutake]|nr:hypothetical protein L208DRAFT_269468 [Tricholoma matsutake 945]
MFVHKEPSRDSYVAYLLTLFMTLPITLNIMTHYIFLICLTMSCSESTFSECFQNSLTIHGKVVLVVSCMLSGPIIIFSSFPLLVLSSVCLLKISSVRSIPIAVFSAHLA